VTVSPARPSTDIGPVVVTGATGNLGGGVLASLTAAGFTVRAGVTDPDAWHHDGVATVHLDLTDPTTFPDVLTGAGALFLVRPPAIARVGPTLNRLVDVAVAAGVRHVVFASVARADTNVAVPHHRAETHLQAAATSFTILRPGFFAQNLGDAYQEDIRDDDRLYVPAGDGRVAFLDVRDLGDLTATILADPTAHAGRGYHLTGPDAVTFDDVADLLTSRLDRPIRYQPATVTGYLTHLRRRRLPVAQVAVQTLLHIGLRRGDAAPVTSTMAELLGRPPRTLDDYVTDHLHLWSHP